MERFEAILGLGLVCLGFWSSGGMAAAAAGCSQAVQAGGGGVTGFYIFGDSLVDNGNNNRLVTLARANYRPYGLDFPLGTTGRFTNGRTFVDVLGVALSRITITINFFSDFKNNHPLRCAVVDSPVVLLEITGQLLGFRTFIPPYSRTRGRALLRGVNYASGASGIRDETGNNLGGHLSMNNQVENFGRTVEEMGRILRDSEAVSCHLSKSIMFIGMGSNDYLNNYFMTDFYNTKSQYTPQAYASALIQDYSHQLTKLYQLGARKVVVTGVGQIGCIPYELARYQGNNTSRCNEEINNAITLFNSGLRKLVDRFNNDRALSGSKFVYLDTYQSNMDLIGNASTYGFKVVDKGCCGVGKNNGQITCLPLQQACEDRRGYLFWDAFHPTEDANIVLAKMAFDTPSTAYAYPINIHQLAML